MTSESGSTALRAYRTRPNDHKSQMVLQALLIAAAWNFVMALAVTIYIRSWSGLLALPAEEGVPVLFFFFFPCFLGCDIHCLWRPTGGQESMFQRYHKAIIDRERYREILYKRYTTYHSSMWTQNGVFLVGADLSKSFFYQGLERDGPWLSCHWSCQFSQAFSIAWTIGIQQTCHHSTASESRHDGNIKQTS